MAANPRTLGPYEILGPLGAGGMGEVYKARDTRLGREVAIKVLPAARSGSREAEARFEREAKASAAVSHPNICAIYDVGSHEGRSFIVMELLEGETLHARLTRGPFDVAPLLDHATALVDAVDAAHSRGLLHRDLKPANVFLTTRGQVKVLDFGLAKAIQRADEETHMGDGPLTEGGTTVGTVGYMAPEQLRGEAVDARADVFALGALVYEMATGQRAFPGRTTALATDAILRQTPKAPRLVRPELPAALDAAIMSALEKDRDTRCQSAGELRAQLRRVRRDCGGAEAETAVHTVSAVAPASAPSHPVSSDAAVAAGLAKRHPALLAGLAVLAVATLVWSLRSPASSPGATNGTSSGPAAVAAPANSIAVLPFADLSERRDQEYFSDGLAEELLNQLTKLPQLQVVARTSSFSFKGKTDDVRAIARQLNVANIVEGSVRKAGDRLRVTTQLIRADTGIHLWSETFDRELKDIFSVQDEIATKVVAALQLRLSPGQHVGGSRRTSNLEAYNHYLLGREQYERFTPDANLRAAAAYRQAVMLDAAYAAAHAELAMATFNVADLARDAAGYRSALASAERAVTLAPEEGTAYGVRAYLRFIIDWDWAGAEADFNRGLSLTPGDSVMHRRYSTFLGGLGRVSEALAAAKKAVDLDPLSTTAASIYGVTLAVAGQLATADAVLSRVVEVAPGPLPLSYLALVQLRAGKASESLATSERIQDPLLRLRGITFAEHSLGRTQGARQSLERFVASFGNVSPTSAAWLYGWRGEKDEAFRWLDRAFDARDSQLPRTVRTVHYLEPLRSDPRYAAFIAKMKFPD